MYIPITPISQQNLKIIFTDILYLIRLPWSAVVKPAADLARNGFKVRSEHANHYST
jgi:hypothetical protein